jgi:hypothetical protein
MGGHNRPYPSLRWVGLDDEQIVWMSGSCMLSEARGPTGFSCLFGLFGLFG